MANNTLPGKLRFTQGGVVFGDSVACDTILPEGWIAVNTDSDNISVHDGKIKGGIATATQPTNLLLDPITNLTVPDPRKVKCINAQLIRGTVSIDISSADELLIVASNSSTTTNAMTMNLMDSTINKSILSEGAALSSSIVSVPKPIGTSAEIVASTNSAGFAVTLGE